MGENMTASDKQNREARQEREASASRLKDDIARALCQSGKFETGEGTCALVCMDQPGNARRDCHHRTTVFAGIVDDVVVAVGRAIMS